MGVMAAPIRILSWRLNGLRKKMRFETKFPEPGPRRLNRLRKKSILRSFPAFRLWQGLKPCWFVGFIGTTEVVPFYKAGYFQPLEGFSAAGKAGVDSACPMYGLKPVPFMRARLKPVPFMRAWLKPVPFMRARLPQRRTIGGSVMRWR